MTLDEQVAFLRENGWGWYVDALIFHRDRLTKEEEESRDREGIVRSKRDYFELAITKLANHISKQNR